MSASSQVREAARRALGKLGAPEQKLPPDAVDQVVLSIRAGATSEMVSLTVRTGDVTWSCTCGVAGCPHAAVALRWLAGEESAGVEPAVRGDELPSDRRSLTPGAIRTAEPQQPLDANRTAIADALDDVLTAVVRAGAAAHDSPSVAEMIERLVAAAPTPRPIGVARWIGRLRNMLAARDLSGIARLLDGGRLLADALRAPKPDAPARARIAAWLGATASDAEAIDRRLDHTLIEIARERVNGLERASIERRYLFDLATGEILREERERGDAGASIGPCPRRIDVGLAEVERGVGAQRIRLMQYAVTTDVGKTEWARIEESAVRLMHALLDGYRDVITRHPGISEPFVVFGPSRVERDAEGIVLIDDAGDPLALARADDPGGADAVSRWAGDGRIVWVAGRLTDVDSTLLLVPCSVGLVIDNAFVFRRVT